MTEGRSRKGMTSVLLGAFLVVLLLSLFPAPAFAAEYMPLTKQINGKWHALYCYGKYYVDKNGQRVAHGDTRGPGLILDAGPDAGKTIVLREPGQGCYEYYEFDNGTDASLGEDYKNVYVVLEEDYVPPEDTSSTTHTVITGTIAVFQIVPTETATAKVQLWKLQINPDFVQQVMVFVLLLYILRFFWRLFE